MATKASPKGAIALVNEQAEARAGRPTIYNENMCQTAIIHLTGIDPAHADKDGRINISDVNVGTIRGLAARLDISEKTIYEWIKNIPEFRKAVEKAKAIQEEILTQRMVKGVGNMTGTIFTMKNLHGWADKIEQKTTISMTDRIAEHQMKGERVDWDKPHEIIDVREQPDGKLAKQTWADDTSTHADDTLSTTTTDQE